MATQLHNKVLLATVRDLLASNEKLRLHEESERDLSVHGGNRDKNGSFSSMEIGSGSDQETTELQGNTVNTSQTADGRPNHLNFELDSYPSTDSLLDELLCEIRRSVTTSLTSTPTGGLSSDGGEGENVFECRMRRSEAELKTLGEFSTRGQGSLSIL